MDFLIVPKPVFDKEKDVTGYCISFQKGNALIEGGKAHSFENSVHSPFFEFINDIGLNVLTMNKLIFVPVSNVLLATDIENFCTEERSLIVLMLNKRIDLNEANLKRLARFKKLFFKTAFYNYYDIKTLEPFLPYMDFIFCGSDPSYINPLSEMIKRSKCPVKMIAKSVDTDSLFNVASSYGVDFFEGNFYTAPKIGGHNVVSPLKINYIQLLNQVSVDDFDLVKFADIVQRDTALAVQFLKMVNSSSVRSTKITSMRHAAALLGQKEIKKWVTTALTSALGQENPGELIRLSMLRAKFCENLAGLFEMAIHKDNLYLMGLFSVLDVILESSMEDAFKLIHVPEVIKNALLGKQNDFGNVFHFIRCYEQADWTEISRIALIRGFDIEQIFNAYHDALKWYGQMITMNVDDEIQV